MQSTIHSDVYILQPNNIRARRSSTISQQRRPQSLRKDEVLKKKKKKTLSGISSGPWNFRQTKLFIKFLREHRNLFYGVKSRRRQKIFIKMSDFIGSRTPDQCRSHHQKVMFHFNQLDDLIVHYQIQILSQIDKDNQALRIKKEAKDVVTGHNQSQSSYSIKYEENSLVISIAQAKIMEIE